MTNPDDSTLMNRLPQNLGPSRFVGGFTQGFSLVEVTLALGVAAICLLAIFGLLPIGLNSNQASVEQTVAASLARAIVTDLRATPLTTGTAVKSPTFKIDMPTSTATSHTLWLDEGGGSVGIIDQPANPSTNPRYRALITITPPPSTAPKTATFVRLLISWPALADKTANVNPTHAAGTFESVTALDRN